MGLVRNLLECVPPVATGRALPTIADYIDQNLDELVRRYHDEVARLPLTLGLSYSEIVDTLYEYLNTLAEVSRTGRPSHAEQTARRLEDTHLALRLRIGFTQQEVMNEYVLMGRIITDLWRDRPRREQPDARDVELLTNELQIAMDRVVTVFTGYTSEDRQTEKRFLRRLDAVSTELMSDFPAAEGLQGHLQPLLEVVQEAMGADGAALFLVDESTDTLQRSCTTGIAHEPDAVVPLQGASYLSRMASTDGVVYLSDAGMPPGAGEPGTEPPHGKGTLRSLLGVRLYPQGRTIGVIYVGVAGIHIFTPRDKRFFEMLADHLGGIVERATFMARAQRAVLAREEVVRIVSHDLRTPLGTIIAAAALLMRETTGDHGRGVRRSVRLIRRSADRMHRLIDDLTDFGSIEAGRLAVDLVRHDPAALIHEAGAANQEAAEDKGLTLRQSLPEELPDIRCDGNRVLQVLDNLLANAFNVTSHGGTVTIAAAAEDAGVRFSVSDTGPGIPAEDLPRLFDRYWRGQSADYRGTGLGLAIARGIVAAHGGRIWADSDLGHGSTFNFTIPFWER